MWSVKKRLETREDVKEPINWSKNKTVRKNRFAQMNRTSQHEPRWLLCDVRRRALSLCWSMEKRGASLLADMMSTKGIIQSKTHAVSRRREIRHLQRLKRFSIAKLTTLRVLTTSLHLMWKHKRPIIIVNWVQYLVKLWRRLYCKTQKHPLTVVSYCQLSYTVCLVPVLIIIRVI